MNNEIAQTIREIAPEIAELRREFHRHPEIRFEERWTSDRVVQFFAELGLPCKRGYAGGTGIVATLECGPGKTVALRADMDGLEIVEQTGAPHASAIPNRMHACGHDGHMACLCGAAKLLARHRGQLHGTVKFIFQPAEESAAAGRQIVDEGALDGVDAVFALHAWPSIPVGKVGVRAGAIMAMAGWFTIEVCGRGCHGADPGTGVDPILAAAHIVTALQSIVSRELDPWEAGVVSVGRIQAGAAPNVIPDTAIMEGTIRALNGDTADRIARAIERIAQHTAEAYRATAQVTFDGAFYPATVNDPAMTEVVRHVVAETLGAGALTEVEHPSMTAEDFAFYLEKVPGAFIWLGNGPNAPLHSPQFDFNDESIPTALTLLTGLAFRLLGE
ncbi:MAG: Amidohydrolase [Candidatus Hydrogenedentes bacterium]|nr:Amidohydrolase [Candidatus Hydrogenedentota bacterium]